jgi:hypothetical protein
VWDGRWLRTLDRNGNLLNPITAFSLNDATTARIGHRSRDVQKAQKNLAVWFKENDQLTVTEDTH